MQVGMWRCGDFEIWRYLYYYLEEFYGPQYCQELDYLDAEHEL